MKKIMILCIASGIVAIAILFLTSCSKEKSIEDCDCPRYKRVWIKLQPIKTDGTKEAHPEMGTMMVTKPV